MLTSADLQLIRDADPGVKLPGIDTPTGNLDPASALLNYTKITQSRSAPYYYVASSNSVIVTQNGAVLSGINFGSAALDIRANNVTVKDCTFTDPTNWWAINQYPTYQNATVENCSFIGTTAHNTMVSDTINSTLNITIKDNSFIDTARHCIDLEQGTVTGNYFSGGGYQTGAHSDAISVAQSTGPVSITDNFIDWTDNANAAIGTNAAVRIVDEFGVDVDDVSVSGNFLFGGSYTVGVSGAIGDSTVSNISVTNNYTGFGQYGAYYPGTQTNATVSGNTNVSFANPISSAQALTAYKAAIASTGAIAGTTANELLVSSSSAPTHVIAATTAGQTLTSSSSAPTTLLGNDLATTFIGSTSETNFVSGYGGHRLVGGQGANIFTYLAISDSTPGLEDKISGFDPAKDVIDLSRIDANITTPGLQHFTFIGSAPFSGDGAQVRYQLNPATDITYVEADVASDSAADFEIAIIGLAPLTASNFALTPAQSVADMANGASLTETKVKTASGAPTEYAYTNAKGASYSSYETFYEGVGGFTVVGAQDLNLSATTDELRLYEPNLTVTRSGAETFQVGTSAADPLSYHSVQTIDATTSGAEHFVFGTGFGNETIQGFAASGATPDTIQLATSSFSYLTAGMTQAQDLAAVLAHASSGVSGLTIADSHGDSLTLAGLTAATITANPAMIKFA